MLRSSWGWRPLGELWDKVADTSQRQQPGDLQSRSFHPGCGTPARRHSSKKTKTPRRPGSRALGRPAWTSPSAPEISTACSWPVWPSAWWLAASSSVSPCPRLLLLWVVSFLVPLGLVSRHWAEVGGGDFTGKQGSDEVNERRGGGGGSGGAGLSVGID